MTEQVQARIVLVTTVLVVLAILLLLLVLPDLSAFDPGRYPGPTTPKQYPEP